MAIVGIETRATIPSKNLQQFEKEIFSFGFAGSLLSGTGIFPNGIILRSEEQKDDPEITALEFSYPPFDIKKEEICENVCNQYSVFFHLIKQYSGNPYPWYINLRERESKIEDYKNLKIVRGIAVCSINPFHLTTDNHCRIDCFYPLSLGEVDFGAPVLIGPYLFLKYESGNLRKDTDLRELAKDFVFNEDRITFGIRVNEDSKGTYPHTLHHFALTALPHDVLPGIKLVDKDFASDLKNNSLFIPLEDSILEKVENELKDLEKNLPEDSLDKIPIKEIISNRNKLKGMAKKYLEEKWGVENNFLTNAYALFLSQVDYVEKVVQKVDKKLYDVTNFHVVECKEDWLTKLTKKYKMNIRHVLSKYNEEKGIVNYRIEIQNTLD